MTDGLSRTVAASNRLVRQPRGRSLPGVVLRVAWSIIRVWIGKPHATARLIGSRIWVDLREPTGKAIYRYGAVGPELEMFFAMLRPGDLVIDGGANIGLASVPSAAAVGPEGVVISVEASEATASLLQANRDLNGYSWIRLERAALTDSVGTAEFSAFAAGSGLSHLAVDTSEASYTVTTATIDSLASAVGRRVAAIKLDIEGAEALALRGARRTLVRDSPVLLLEVDATHLARQGSSVEELDSILRDNFYTKLDRIADDGTVVELSSLADVARSGTTNVLCRVAGSQ